MYIFLTVFIFTVLFYMYDYISSILCEIISL